MVQKFNLPFNPAREERTIHLYLPEEYFHTEERYPVLYMFDGQNLFYDQDATFGKSWGLRDYLDNWHKKLIVVGMECSHTGNDRIKEYCPYKIWSRFTGRVEGTAQQTMDWVVNEVKSFIDGHYRTWAHREATAIGGSSMGGMISLYAVLQYNRWFSKAACVSPAIGFAMKNFRSEIEKSVIHPDTRIFFSWGTHEWKRSDAPMTRNILDLEKRLQGKGARTWLFHQQGGRHCEADWEVQVPTWMEFLWCM